MTTHFASAVSEETNTSRSASLDEVEPQMEPRDEKYRHWIFTVPNIICIARALGAIVMFLFAVGDMPYAFATMFVLLTLSDWIDGPLARWMHQRSEFGARIDSFADSLMYGGFIFGLIILSREVLVTEWPWIAMVIVSYIVTSGAGLIKFGRIPSYHTFAAKKSQYIVLVGGVILVLGWAVWPARIAALAVMLTNIEATILTLILPKWHADVLSLWHVWKRREFYFPTEDPNQPLVPESTSDALDRSEERSL